jgi:Glycogen recognition site of AMP-activated protein kinase
MKRADKKLIHRFLDGSIGEREFERSQSKNAGIVKYTRDLEQLIAYSESLQVPKPSYELSVKLDNLAINALVQKEKATESLFAMIFKPVTIRVSPAMVLLSAIMLIAAVSLPVSFLFSDLIQRRSDDTLNKAAISIEGANPDIATFTPASVEVGEATFIYHDTQAGKVSLVGDFNSWNPEATPLVETGEGLWTVNLELRKGTYEYLFVVDGTFKTDPRADIHHDDGFGNVNAVLEL